MELAGVTVSSATLHNEEIIAQKDIREGDWVEVVRAGEVIPQVLGPVRATPRRHRDAVPHARGSARHAAPPVERPADEAMRYCPNVACPGRVLEGIVHFAGRGAMDIRGLGYERVRQLLDAGLIRDVRGPVRADGGADWCNSTGSPSSPPSSSCRRSTPRRRSPSRSCCSGSASAMSGSRWRRLLARQFGTLDALMPASREAIDDVPGVGSTIGEAVADFFAEPRNRRLMERLRTRGSQFHRAGPGAWWRSAGAGSRSC